MPAPSRFSPTTAANPMAIVCPNVHVRFMLFPPRDTNLSLSVTQSSRY
jgi:hypothetical protein